MTSVSAAVMAHSTREPFVQELTGCLDADAPVVWDRRGDRWDTGRRSLLAYDPAATHHLVIQDDAIVCQDLVAAVTRAAAVAGEHPIGLYTGKVRPYKGRVAEDYTAAARAGATWLEMNGPWWGVGIVIPTAHIRELIRWADRRRDIANYDRRIARWYATQGTACWYTVPSLVDHRPVKQNPSLVAGRTGNRRAHSFIGAHTSGLTIDWKPAPYRPAEARKAALRARRSTAAGRARRGS